MSEAKFIQGPILFNEAKLKDNPEGKFILAGRFGLAEDVNENVRVYTKRLWKNILNRPSVRQMIKDKRMLGQLGHPETVEPDLQNVSHAVTFLELRDDGEIYGEAEVFDTPAGKILKILYNAGVRLGISSRGYIPDDVDYTEGVGEEVPDEYELVGFDFVIDPSTHGAFPTLKESTKRQLNKIVLESKSKLGKSLCESINHMIYDSPKKYLQFSLDGVSNVKRKQIRGLMEGKYPEAEVLISEDKLKISNLSSKKQISATSYFNKLVNENSFIKKINSQVAENNKEVEQMSNEIVSAQKVTEGNYELAKQVIAELLNDKSVATAVIEDLVKRYKVSEEKLNKLSMKLESKEKDTSTLDTAEEIISELRDRYLLAEDIIKDLVTRYRIQDRKLRKLQKRYKVAESVANSVTVSNKVESDNGETSEEVIAELVRRLKSSEEVIAELRDRYLISEKVIEDLKSRYTLSEDVISQMADTIKLSEGVISDLINRYLLSEEVISDLRDRYLLSEEVISEFKKASSSIDSEPKKVNKSITESKVTPKATSNVTPNVTSKVTPKATSKTNDYSEYPYTKKVDIKKKVVNESVKTTPKVPTTKREAYEAKLASIVASVQ